LFTAGAIALGACASAGVGPTNFDDVAATGNIPPPNVIANPVARIDNSDGSSGDLVRVQPASTDPYGRARLSGNLVGEPPPFFLRMVRAGDASGQANGLAWETIVTNEWPTAIAVSPTATSFRFVRRDGEWLIEPSAADTTRAVVRPGASISFIMEVINPLDDELPEGEYSFEIPIAFWTDLADEGAADAPDGVATLELRYTVLPASYVETLSRFCAVATSGLVGHDLLSANELLDRLETVESAASGLNTSDRQLVTSEVRELREALVAYEARDRGFSTSELVERINILCGSSLASTASEVGE